MRKGSQGSDVVSRQVSSHEVAVRAHSPHKAVAIYKNLSTLLGTTPVDGGSIDDFKFGAAQLSSHDRESENSLRLFVSHGLASAGIGLAISSTTDATKGAQVVFATLHRLQTIVLSHLHRTWDDWVAHLSKFHLQFDKAVQKQMWREAIHLQADATPMPQSSHTWRPRR
ncbi:hypothetical protein CBOM_06454 [Ceraceosorus bombacis]|uniref:Uncharacterized protein n=1 Tax=Ceraceosorus bombacis TaxID=401625 RepID=A0A0P1BL60_9BASI|nr:hypothetical protein CBOM_06454 [Ceraceosorus bombacis]